MDDSINVINSVFFLTLGHLGKMLRTIYEEKVTEADRQEQIRSQELELKEHYLPN